MLKKALGLTIATVILLGMFGLIACDNNSLHQYKTDAKTTIRVYADAKGQNNYNLDGWAVIEQTVIDRNQAIDNASDKETVDTAVAAGKSKINAVLTKEQEMNDFVLMITVDYHTKNRGEDFIVEVCLKNQSGSDVEIATGYTHNNDGMGPAIQLFSPELEGWKFLIEPSDALPGVADLLTIADGAQFNETFNLGSVGLDRDYNEVSLPKGTHDLRFCAIFSLGWGTNNQQEITIWSNTVILIIK